MDGTGPNAPIVNEVTDQHTSVKGKAEASTIVEVKNGSTFLGSSTVSASGDFSVGMAKQTWNTKLSVYVIDQAGNQSDPTVVTVVDKTGPQKPVVNPVGDNSTSVKGRTEGNAVVYAKVGSTEIGRTTANASGEFSVSFSMQKTGTEIQFIAVDGALNRSEEVYVTVEDKTAPSRPAVHSVEDQSTTITGKAEGNSNVFAKKGSTEIGTAPANHMGEFSITIEKQKTGTEISVYSVDKAGNKGSASSIIVQNQKPKLKTLIGATRYSTAVEVSKEGWATSSTVFLVNGSAIADGLTATPLASAHDAPILLTTKGNLPVETVEELNRLGTKKIVLIG